MLSKVWPLDGEERPSRKPSIWEEVAQAVDMELGSRADARACTDSINAIGDGSAPACSTLGTPTATCKHCKRTGHPPEVCPFKAAERRGHVEKMIKENEENPERVCAYCGAADHRDYHHRLGISDANYTIGQNGNTLSWNGGSSAIKYTPKKDGSDSVNALTPGRSGGGAGGRRNGPGTRNGGGGARGGGGTQPVDTSRLRCPFGMACRFLVAGT